MNLFLTCYDDLRSGGGSPRRALRLGSALVRRGHTVHIASKTAQKVNDFTSQEIQGCTVHWYVAPLGIGWRLPSLCRERALYRALRHRGVPRPDWGLTFSPFFHRPLKRLWPKVKLAYLFPCLLSNHTPANTLREKLDAALLRRIERHTLTTADKVILQSSVLETEIHDFADVNQDKLRIIPPGIEAAEPTKSRAHIRGELQTPEEAMVCLVTSRLDQNKNVEHILRSVQKLDGPCVLWIAGDGPRAQHLAALSDELGMTARVRFLGYRNDLDNLRAAADVFVHAAWYDAYPQALLEALQSGLIPIAPRNNPPRVTSSAEEIYPTNAGFHYDLTDPDALMRTLQNLIHQPGLRAGLSVMARQFATEHYNLDTYAEAIERELQS